MWYSLVTTPHHQHRTFWSCDRCDPGRGMRPRLHQQILAKCKVGLDTPSDCSHRIQTLQVVASQFGPKNLCTKLHNLHVCSTALCHCQMYPPLCALGVDARAHSHLLFAMVKLLYTSGCIFNTIYIFVCVLACRTTKTKQNPNNRVSCEVSIVSARADPSLI